MSRQIPPSLIVRMKSTSRDMDVSAGTIALPDKDNIKIVEGGSSPLNPWDKAYQTFEVHSEYSFVEPEVESGAAFYTKQEEVTERGDDGQESYYKFIDDWSHPDNPSVWHLDNNHSQLQDAKAAVAELTSKKTVRIAHLDTGYTKGHISFPSTLIRHDLEKHFFDGEEGNTAEDIFSDGTLKMPGHGTGTLSILAGAKTAILPCEFDDHLGLYDSVEIVPIRIAKSVVLFKSGAFVKALDYIVNELSANDNSRVHVVTMSMGGVASNAWADMVNLAYDKGIFIVTAAGNNYKKLPTRTMIFPARFNRVVAACGVTYDLSPYSRPRGEGSFNIMEGNFGPQALMNTTMAAFTPNVTWATYKFNNVVGIRGDGTSSATPQIASAAALYYIKNYDALETLPEPWMRVEAIRKAMFESAKKEINSSNGSFDNDYAKYYGNGILQANKMLGIPVAAPAELSKQDEDKVRFPLFKVIFGIRALEGDAAAEEDMMETELMQLVLTDETLQAILNNEEKKLEDLSKEEKKQVAEAVLANKDASDKLKERMQMILNQLNL